MRWTLRWTLVISLIAVFAWHAYPAQPVRDPGSLKDKHLSEVGGKTLEQWIKEIPSPDRFRGELAIQVMWRFPPQQAYAAVPVLLSEMAKHRPPDKGVDLSIRVNITIALGYILGGVERKDTEPKHVTHAVELLTKGLADPQAVLRFRSAEALARMPKDAKPALPALLAAVQDGATWEVRDAAVGAVGLITREYKEMKGDLLNKVYVTLFTRLLEKTEKTSQVRLTAVRSLAFIGSPNNEKHKKMLIDALELTAAKDTEPRVVLWSNMAIMGMLRDYPENRLANVSKLLQYPEVITKIEAAQALATLGPKAKSQVPALTYALKDKDAAMVGWTIFALSRMGPAAAPALKPLEEVRSDKAMPEGIRKAAEEAIDIIKGVKVGPK